MRRIRTRLPTCRSTGLGALVAIPFSLAFPPQLRSSKMRGLEPSGRGRYRVNRSDALCRAAAARHAGEERRHMPTKYSHHAVENCNVLARSTPVMVMRYE